MKPKFATRCCVVALLLLPLAVPAADATRPPSDPAPMPAPTEIVVKDAAMTARVEARLADEKLAELDQVKVAADSNGNVVLSGRVKTQTDEEKAVSIARDTEGVKLVRSTIRIGPDK